MIFKIQQLVDKTLEQNYERAMGELNEFYEKNWVYNRPRVIVVPDRQTIDQIRDIKTESWMIGWTNSNFAFILENENMEQNSNHHKHDPEEYFRLIKHELSHVFFRQISQSKNGPEWLWEGVAIFTSGDILYKKPIEKFTRFLESTKEKKDGVYQESGRAIELLVKSFGKEKLLELIKALKNCPTDESFNQQFAEIYSFTPDYKKFNQMLEADKA